MSKKSKKKKKNKKQQQNQQWKQNQQLRTCRTDEIVVDMSTMPQLLRVFISSGCVLKYVGIYILTMFLVVMVTSIFEYGIKVSYLIDFITFWNIENLFILFMVAGPFVLWYISAKWLKKHYKEIHFKACEDKVMIEQKVGKPIMLTYEELGLSIRTRKIKIGPDWIEIPYDTGIRQVSPEWTEGPLTEKKIRLYSFGKKDVGKFLVHLSRKCDTPYEKHQMEENIEGYTAGWITTYFIGWPILLGSIYLCGWLYALEGYRSLWELIKDVPERHIWVLVGCGIGIFFIMIGYCLKFLLLILLRKTFKPYKNFFHISW